MIKQIFSRIEKIDLEQSITQYFQTNWQCIRLFLFLFATNILVYGQKLFFHSLLSDDYNRFFLSYPIQILSWGRTAYQTGFSGRWGADLINSYIFTGAFHILPFIHILVGIFCITLAGFLTAYILKQKNPFTIIVVTLLCSSTIFFAKNLAFITNISAWITTFLGVYSLYLFYRYQSIFIKILAVLMLAFAIGCYQTILQVCLMIVAIKTTLELWQAKDKAEFYTITKSSFFAVIFLFLAVVIHQIILEIFIAYLQLRKKVYVEQTQIHDISYYFKNLIALVTKGGYLNLFFYLLLIGSAIIYLISLFFSPFFTRKKFGFYALYVIVLFLIVFIVILYLPTFLFDVYAPLRAHYTIGWLAAGIFLFLATSHRFFKNCAIIGALLLFIGHIYAINTYFYSDYRQTKADIIIANQIVSTIRTNDNYQQEPVKLLIIGKSDKRVIGNPFYASSRGWSKYHVIRHFTDFDFERMDKANRKNIVQKLVAKGELLPTYPAKGSIYIEGDSVVVFFDTKKINQRIIANQIVSTIRANDNYQQEPVELFLLGYSKKSSYPVIKGLNWGIYHIIRRFSDFDFEKMDKANQENIVQKFVAKGEQLSAYPAKGSIYIEGDSVVVFFDTKKINQRILEYQKQNR